MKFQLLEPAVLERNLPDHGLRHGDLGAVVQVYGPDGLEIEFVSTSGKTEELVTLTEGDVRAVADGDLVAVRRLARSASRTTQPTDTVGRSLGDFLGTES